MQKIDSNIRIRCITLNFKSRISKWCATVDSTKKSRVVGLMLAISVRKSSIPAVALGVCALKWNDCKFLSCHYKIFADDLYIDLGYAGLVGEVNNTV